MMMCTCHLLKLLAEIQFVANQSNGLSGVIPSKLGALSKLAMNLWDYTRETIRQTCLYNWYQV
ncbi:hypothetical protein IGI04_040756 [Brassica rapa subsp. trilocularis]|uniref:Uncharacterized protein n=1 Tax=Brassica rapa subsp. trilocularis TaxID=1813537 RepID=A0ABQ7KRQ3_BRACM|nr:hypothetical protein IGI04_040756 [Brassica rapa subsp. trilocularis]